MAIRVTETIYFVRDIEAARRFYAEQMGFELLEEAEWGWLLFQMDPDHQLGIMAESAWEKDDDEPDGLPLPRIGIKTDDLDAEVRRLAQSGIDVAEPTGEEGGYRSTTFKDPDGNAFHLWEDGTGTL
ncbi:MAG: VOC family protein [Fimbriimonadaceae bacterium]